MKDSTRMCAWLFGAALFIVGCGGGDGDDNAASGSRGSTSSSSSGAGGEGGASCVPVAEACDGVDNNCDGVIDEGCACKDGQTQGCYSGPMATKDIGECHSGTQTCKGGAWGACEGEALPGDEACDGLDNDCDGQSDEDLGMATCGVGACASTVPSCVDGKPGECVPGIPSPEVCDGVDNNCDGAIDEGDPGAGFACDTGIPGQCALGSTACAGGIIVCNQNAAPSDESCDGIDNNCDGAVDEGDPGGGAACTTGLMGICAAGTTACVSGGVVCQQENQPSAEVCDGLDNNCDGAVDENNPGGGTACSTGMPGVCASGTTACVGGAIACNQNTQPSAEICDGVDNNCDGAVDENNPGGGQACSTGMLGVCAAGVKTCSNGAVVCAPTKQPSAELCGNGADDDCDGRIDEGLEPTGWEARITNSVTQSSALQVLWTGSEYAVLYREYMPPDSTPVIFLQRVNAAGALIGAPLMISSPTADSSEGRIAWNGSEYAVVYWTYEVWPDDAIRFQRVSSGGALVGAAIDIDPNPSAQPDIVWNGSDYAVTWLSRQSGQMMFRRISSAGSFLSPAAALGAAHSIGEIAWTGSQYGVIWDLYDYGTGNNTGYFTRVVAAGSEIGNEVVTTPSPTPGIGCCGIAALFDIAWNGSAFSILRRGALDRPTFIPVSAAGVVSPSTAVINEEGMYPEMIWNGNEYLATFWWFDPRLSFARLSPAGTFIGRYMLKAATHPGVSSANIAWDGSALVATWSDQRYGNDEVSLARYSTSCQ